MTHSPSSAQSNEMKLSITPTQIQALYLLLLRRHRPEFGWMEEPLVAIEAALKPAHDAIHDRSFNAMNRQFFGDDRFHLDEAPMPAQLEAHAAASAHTIGEDAANGAMGEPCTYPRCACAQACASRANVAMGEREALIDKLCGQLESAVYFMQKGSKFDCKEALSLVKEARAALTAEKVAGQEAVGKNALVLTAAQLLEALDFIAPDRSIDPEQMESEVAIEYGDGHAGKAAYCWCAEYPEEGSCVHCQTAISRLPKEVSVSDREKFEAWALLFQGCRRR